MLQRLSLALVLAAFFGAPAVGQVVRFETTMGDFDMVLNPTNNPLLQGHVENMLDYVEFGSYRGNWINRADTGFVLQMGGFYSHTKRPPRTIESIQNVAAFTPVEGSPGISGLSNTLGTVSLALPGDGMGGTNEDAGTSSFFVNLTNNSFLDGDFTVFAAIADMTVINNIMALDTIDRTSDSVFGAGAGNLAFSDVAIMDDGKQVFILRAFEVNDTLTVARARAAVSGTMAASASAAGSGGLAPGAALGAVAVPEPSAIATLAIGAAALFSGLSRRRR
jgi:cyclophilin family peptidyl-prolyl cis-trans isomerase